MTDTATRRCVFCVPGTQTLGRISAWEFHRRLPVSEVRSKKGKLCFWLIINCSRKTNRGAGSCPGGASDVGAWINEAAVMGLKCRTVRCCSKLTPFVLDCSPFPRLRAEWASVCLTACMGGADSDTVLPNSVFFHHHCSLVFFSSVQPARCCWQKMACWTSLCNSWPFIKYANCS